jgi:3-isopropylmalate/(R)-2-methylmalate dehydratase small subunit
MHPFKTLTATAAPLNMINIDTDMIIPKQFLKTIKRTGLGAHLFDEMRFTPEGKEIPEFVLNQAPYRKAEVLIAGDNFGCGSSREHAPWAILDFGIRCIIAPSYADIFYNNCFKNGILPIKLPKAMVDELAELAKSQPENPISIDLEKQEIRAWNKVYSFDLDAFRKKCLLEGLDDIGQTLQKQQQIASFEQKQSADKPWLYQCA